MAAEKRFQLMKKEKAQEIVMLLDLFDGKITLTELLETDIPIINQLRDAKLELNKQQELERQKLKATQSQNIMKK